MDEQFQIDAKELLLEISRYLAAVDLYRAERCEPTWLPESAAPVLSVEHLPARAEHAPSAN